MPSWPLQRYLGVVEYDGRSLNGWQKQSEKTLTVQELIENALGITLNRYLKPYTDSSSVYRTIVHGAGRTDAGVSAAAMVFHFDTIPGLDLCMLQGGLNYFLNPNAISIRHLQPIANTFHARFSAIRRTYTYTILNRVAASPLLEHAWHLRRPLDIDHMQKAANCLIGYHDFSSFRDSDCQAQSPFRSLENFSIKREGELIKITVVARSFLHHQVRIMVGTLKMFGLGRTIEDMERIVLSRDRKQAGQTAPAHGLCFETVSYDDAWNLKKWWAP